MGKVHEGGRRKGKERREEWFKYVGCDGMNGVRGGEWCPGHAEGISGVHAY